MSAIERVADECARTLVERYRRTRIAWGAEWGDLVSIRDAPGPVNVYVKSVQEASIDEIPIIAAILDGLRGRRIEFYEYERMTRGDLTRETVLARLLETAVRRRRPTIIVMPSALPASLYSRLPGEVREALSGSLALRVWVENENTLYLPLAAPGGIEIVAKANSQSSYARVRWLRGEAVRRGLRVRREVYLPDNSSIMSYVLSGGLDTVGERVPVNKLAHYIVALQDCGRITGVSPLSRWERSTHLVYAVNTSVETLEPVYRALSRPGGGSLEDVLVGLLYNEVLRGARKVMERILSRLIESLF